MVIEIPDKHYLFNGNLLSPGEGLFMLLLVPIMALLCVCYQLYTLSGITSRVPDTTLAVPVIIDNITDSYDYRHYSSDNTEYVIPKSIFYDHTMQQEHGTELVFIIASENAGNQEILVWEILNKDGHEIINSSEVLYGIKKIETKYLVFSIVFFFCACLLSLFAYYILCHASDYPKLARLLVRDYALNYYSPIIKQPKKLTRAPYLQYGYNINNSYKSKKRIKRQKNQSRREQ